MFVQDCVAGDVVYHKLCYNNFNKPPLNIPKVFCSYEPPNKKASVGTPEDIVRLEAFQKVSEYLDSVDAAQVTVKDLVDVMGHFLKDAKCEAYSHPYMKTKLIEHYGDGIVFAQSHKKADIISLKKTADSILRDFYNKEKQSEPEAEKKRIIKAAASLIQSDIASLPSSKDEYPDSEAIKDHIKSVPQSLRTVLQHVTRKAENSVKISAIGQAIIQLSRPNTVIAPGRVADATVNVDQAESIGKQILTSIVGQTALDISFRKKLQAVTMAMKGTLSKPNEEVIHVDPMLLFQRLVKVAENTPDCLEEAFEFEMSNIPPSLFDSDGLPRQAKKASLASYLWAVTKQASAELPEEKVHVIDGGYLLHLLTWARGCTYNAIAQSYVDFTKRMFGKGVVVYDGYSNNPSTKDVAHLRRKQKAEVASDFIFDGETVLSVPKERFLANANNKSRFISLLSSHLVNNGFDTIHASADADCRIVHTTLETAKHHNVVLIGEDTDLLILLLHHCTPDHHPVFFTSTRSSSAKVWDIQAVQTVLGEDVCKHVLFAHAIGGCDTVSGLFSIGKSIPLKKVMESANFREQADAFTQPPVSDTKDKVTDAGEKVLVDIYGGKRGDKLNTLRYIKYMQKLSSSTSVFQPCKLSPTAAAAKFHCYRTYLQVQQWMNLQEDNTVQLNAEDWGREVAGGMLLPILTDIAAASDNLLNDIKCTCKSDCQSARCSCRKHGLLCTSACGECRGESCANALSNVIYIGDDDEIDDE